jgi:hypothetical protein
MYAETRKLFDIRQEVMWRAHPKAFPTLEIGLTGMVRWITEM